MTIKIECPKCDTEGSLCLVESTCQVRTVPRNVKSSSPMKWRITGYSPTSPLARRNSIDNKKWKS